MPLEGAPEQVYAAVFSPDGKYVVALQERDAVVWRVDRPTRPLSVLKGHRGPVNEMNFSRDNRILTAGSDGTVRVWDTSGRQLSIMRGNDDEVTTAIFTTDGGQVLSSGQDGSLRLFDARTGAALAVLQSEGELYDVAAEPRRDVATLGTGEVVRVVPCDFCGSLDRRARARARPARRGSSRPRSEISSSPRPTDRQRVLFPTQQPGVLASQSSPVAR